MPQGIAGEVHPRGISMHGKCSMFSSRGWACGRKRLLHARSGRSNIDVATWLLRSGGDRLSFCNGKEDR